MKTPKSQVTAEQPLTKKHWNLPKKDTLHPKTKRKPQREGRSGAIMINSNPILLRGLPTNWKAIMPQKLSHRSECFEAHVRFSSLGVW